MSGHEFDLPSLTSKQHEALVLQYLALNPDQEEVLATRYLARLAEKNPGRLPYDVFLAFAMLKVTGTVEVALTKPSAEDPHNPSVVLTQRPPEDVWARQWHLPGSAILPTDPVEHEHDHNAAISRVLEEVGGDLEIVGPPIEYDTVRRIGRRGSEITVRLLAAVVGNPENGAFFTIPNVLHEPPEGGLVETHDLAIAGIARAYHMLSA